MTPADKVAIQAAALKMQQAAKIYKALEKAEKERSDVDLNNIELQAAKKAWDEALKNYKTLVAAQQSCISKTNPLPFDLVQPSIPTPKKSPKKWIDEIVENAPTKHTAVRARPTITLSNTATLPDHISYYKNLAENSHFEAEEERGILVSPKTIYINDEPIKVLYRYVRYTRESSHIEKYAFPHERKSSWYRFCAGALTFAQILPPNQQEAFIKKINLLNLNLPIDEHFTKDFYEKQTQALLSILDAFFPGNNNIAQQLEAFKIENSTDAIATLQEQDNEAISFDIAIPLEPHFWKEHTIVVNKKIIENKSVIQTNTLNVVSRIEADDNQFQAQQIAQARMNLNLKDHEDIPYKPFLLHTFFGAIRYYLHDPLAWHALAIVDHIVNPSANGDFHDLANPSTIDNFLNIDNDYAEDIKLDLEKIYRHAMEIEKIQYDSLFIDHLYVAALKETLYYELIAIEPKLKPIRNLNSESLIIAYQTSIFGCKTNQDDEQKVALQAKILARKEYLRRQYWEARPTDIGYVSFISTKLFIAKTALSISHAVSYIPYFLSFIPGIGSYIAAAMNTMLNFVYFITGKELKHYVANLSVDLMQRDLPNINKAIDEKKGDVAKLQRQKAKLIDNVIQTNLTIEASVDNTGHARAIAGMPNHNIKTKYHSISETDKAIAQTAKEKDNAALLSQPKAPAAPVVVANSSPCTGAMMRMSPSQHAAAGVGSNSSVFNLKL